MQAKKQAYGGGCEFKFRKPKSLSISAVDYKQMAMVNRERISKLGKQGLITLD